MDGGAIRVELCMVHLSNEGVKTYEVKFVDEDGMYSDTLVVEPDGTLSLGEAP